MKRKTLEQKSTFGAMLVMLMLTAASLTGCASGQTTETAVTAEEAVSGTEKADGEAAGEVVTGTAKAADDEAEEAVSGAAKAVDGEMEKGTAAGTEEATEEDAAEATDGTEGVEGTSEGVVYEGIDMESTLPGLEWIATFDGIITEHKFAIFNDETNKKVIVENGQEVEFCDTDVFAVFFPLEKSIVGAPLDDNMTFCQNVDGLTAREDVGGMSMGNNDFTMHIMEDNQLTSVYEEGEEKLYFGESQDGEALYRNFEYKEEIDTIYGTVKLYQEAAEIFTSENQMIEEFAIFRVNGRYIYVNYYRYDGVEYQGTLKNIIETQLLGTKTAEGTDNTAEEAES